MIIDNTAASKKILERSGSNEQKRVQDMTSSSHVTGAQQQRAAARKTKMQAQAEDDEDSDMWREMFLHV